MYGTESDDDDRIINLYWRDVPDSEDIIDGNSPRLGGLLRCTESEKERCASSVNHQKNWGQQQDEVVGDLFLTVLNYWVKRIKTEKHVQFSCFHSEMRSIVERVEDLIKSGYYEKISLLRSADGLVCVYDDGNYDVNEREEVIEHSIESKDEAESIVIRDKEDVEITRRVVTEAVGAFAISAGSCYQRDSGQQKEILKKPSLSSNYTTTPIKDEFHNMPVRSSSPVLYSHQQNESSHQCYSTSVESKLESEEVEESVENVANFPVISSHSSLDNCLSPDMLVPFGFNLLKEPLENTHGRSLEYGQQCERRWTASNTTGISDSIVHKMASVPVGRIVITNDGMDELDSDSDDISEVFPDTHPCSLCAKEFTSLPDLKSHLLRKHDYQCDDEKEPIQVNDTTATPMLSLPTVEAKLVDNSGVVLDIDELAHRWAARIKKMEWLYFEGFYIPMRKKLKLYKHQKRSAFCKELIDRILSCDNNISIVKSETSPKYNAFRYVSDHQMKEDAKTINAQLQKYLNSLSAVNFQRNSERILRIVHHNNWELGHLRNVVNRLVKRARYLSVADSLLNADLCQKIFTVGDMIQDDEDDAFPTRSTTDLSSTSEGESKNGSGDGASVSNKVPIMTKGKLFREVLVDQVASEFESGLISRKMCYIGHVRFLEAIYSRDIDDGRLPDVIHEHCLKILITSIDEDLLDCLTQLLLTVGCKLELHYQQQQKQKTKKNDYHYDEIIPSCFTELNRIAETHPSNRVKDTISHLLLLRTHGWTTSTTMKKDSVDANNKVSTKERKRQAKKNKVK